jgi:hypothetical protein
MNENREKENPLAGLKWKLHQFEEFGNRQFSASSKDWLQKRTSAAP